MRKAALFVGVICAAFSVAAVVLRMIELPGSAVLFVCFTSLFSVASLGLYLGAQLRESKTFLRKVSLVVLWFGLTDLQIGLLYGAMSWVGVATILLQGVVLAITGALIYFLAGRQQEAQTKLNPVFAVSAMVVYGSLSIGWVTAKERKLLGAEHLITYQNEFRSFQADSSAMKKLERAFVLDITNTSLREDADVFFARAEKLIQRIDEVKQSIVDENNKQFACREDDSCSVLNNMEDFDLSTMMLVGIDVEKPSGKGMEIYSALVQYRKNDLHSNVDFVIPVSSDQTQKEQWVKDNFYHVPAIDVLTRLTVIQKNIIQSAISAVEKKQFVHQQ